MVALNRIALIVLLAGCDPLGKPCTDDDECGPGYDCYPDVCVRVCTKVEECGQGEICYRYHCITPGQEHVHGRGSPPPGATPPTLRQVPPAPDATVAELRAIRRELELLRQEQKRLADLVDKGRAPSKPKAKPEAPKE